MSLASVAKADAFSIKLILTFDEGSAYRNGARIGILCTVGYITAFTSP